jgi:hypothetical protein
MGIATTPPPPKPLHDVGDMLHCVHISRSCCELGDRDPCPTPKGVWRHGEYAPSDLRHVPRKAQGIWICNLLNARIHDSGRKARNSSLLRRWQTERTNEFFAAVITRFKSSSWKYLLYEMNKPPGRRELRRLAERVAPLSDQPSLTLRFDSDEQNLKQKGGDSYDL